MTTKKQRLNELTWKYFWNQKLYELSKFLVVILGIIFVPYLVGLVFNFYLNGEITNCFDIWIVGICVLTIIFITLALIYIIFMLFINWIKSNWEEAEERAREDLK